jgi:hypothetical protein
VEAVTNVLLEDRLAAADSGLVAETALGVELADTVRRAQRDFWKALQ